jgi:hypothetical protein
MAGAGDGRIGDGKKSSTGRGVSVRVDQAGV